MLTFFIKMTHSEENYLKTIYHLALHSSGGINTNAIANKLESKASSVTDMIKKLADKGLIIYQKYQGVLLTEKGTFEAKMIVRKHRLWEVFLVEKLNFNWDEVHEIAEELEHIKSERLINELDLFLGFPSKDPHGDPIPNSKGEIINEDLLLLSQIKKPQQVICMGVKDSSSDFLKFLDKIKVTLGTIIQVIEKEEFDASLVVEILGEKRVLSFKIASNLYVKQI